MAPHDKRPRLGGSVWRRLVRQVIRRDHGICHLCGRPGADTADHITPWSQGGRDGMANLKAAHHNVWPHCNRIRGDRPISYARDAIVKVIAHADQSVTVDSTRWEW